jgi:hypothetical protein
VAVRRVWRNCSRSASGFRLSASGGSII